MLGSVGSPHIGIREDGCSFEPIHTDTISAPSLQGSRVRGRAAAPLPLTLAGGYLGVPPGPLSLALKLGTGVAPGRAAGNRGTR